MALGWCFKSHFLLQECIKYFPKVFKQFSKKHFIMDHGKQKIKIKLVPPASVGFPAAISIKPALISKSSLFHSLPRIQTVEANKSSLLY